MNRPEVNSFFDSNTNTITHIVSDRESGDCAIIDPVLDYDAASGRTSTTSADEVIAYIKAADLNLVYIIETHVHADHLSSAPYIKSKLGGEIVIGEHIDTVQKTFGPIFNAEDGFATDGRQFDTLAKEGENFSLGAFAIKPIYTPGHTPACTSYLIGDVLFVGDTIFMPDFGTARCDFPGGSAETLYDSIQKLFALPDETRMFMCHDYKAPGRDTYAWETTVGEQKANNVHVGGGKSKDEFVKMRTARDAQLSMPKLILPSVQVNMRAGNLPPTESNGNLYLKIPVNLL